MVKVTVCIGSSCHLKGSRQVVEELQYLINKNALGESVDLGGTFCMGTCGENGGRVTVAGHSYAAKPRSNRLPLPFRRGMFRGGSRSRARKDRGLSARRRALRRIR